MPTINRACSSYDYDPRWNNATHQYDERGRIIENSAIGTYEYTRNGYQQQKLTTNELGETYLEKYPLPVIRYNAFKAPEQIYVKDKERISYDYNAFGERSHCYYGNAEVEKAKRPLLKHYSHDGSTEIVCNKTDNSTKFILYLGGDAYSAPAILISDGEAQKLYYLHRDYLGSIVMLTDEEGNIAERRHFDPWGQVLKVEDGAGNTLDKLTLLDRGFTGHEHLQTVGLIHMNGRLYDPALHRFLQPDNFVQDPFNTQNFNRYGYCLNNPLVYVDQNGEFWHIVVGALVGGVVNLVANLNNSQGFWEHLAAFGVGALGGAVTAAVGGSDGGASFLAITGTAAGMGALTMGTNSIIAQTGLNFSGMNNVNWGAVGKNALVGGASGFASGAVGVWATNSGMLVKGINSPVLRSLVVSPLASGTGHIVGGTTYNLLEGQNFKDAFSNSFDGVGQSIAMGTMLGVTTTIVNSYAHKVSPWTGHKLGSRAETLAEELFLSENFGITSEKFSNSITNVRGTWNEPGRVFKMGWSTVSKNGGGMQLRIGIGISPTKSNQALFHFYIPKTFVPNSFSNPSIQIKRSLYNLEFNLKK
ncbi:RHS repeat-associated core domain-containing protein [Capnocytophaga sputigena]|uniref:RHS repeat-associated core domain-containing protein n=1 Tax=Capnocytophaga sputigena TaxID=1019 RepID=UPI00288901C8|nr:RHS repeat-associated core domain-containing protein [Capnocytophaga sputigena]